jgi:hypothetical protein
MERLAIDRIGAEDFADRYADLDEEHGGCVTERIIPKPLARRLSYENPANLESLASIGESRHTFHPLYSEQEPYFYPDGFTIQYGMYVMEQSDVSHELGKAVVKDIAHIISEAAVNDAELLAAIENPKSKFFRQRAS